MAKAKRKKRGGEDPQNRVLASNRRARHDFEIVDRFECGMVLKGSEVKSLRDSKVQIAESYARVQHHELWLHSLHIAPYLASGSAFGHDPDRQKKLLAHRDEIERMRAYVDRDGLTLVPLQLHLKDGRVKIELAVARRKRVHDKRADIAQRDADLEARRAMSRGMRRR